MSTISCDVCQQATYKYKCTSCKAPSCSLVCFKKHQYQCAAAQDYVPVRELVPAAFSSTYQENPAKTLIEKSKLDWLFQRYPQLRSQLHGIYLSTLDPAQRGKEKGLDGLPAATMRNSSISARDRPWKPEKGFERGLASMRTMAEIEHSNSEGLHEFLRMVAGEDIATQHAQAV